MRAVRRMLVLVAVAALTSPAVAYARGGGGSHGFSGSSGGGGGSHGSGSGGIGTGYNGSTGGSGSLGDIHFSSGLLIALAVVAGLVLIAWLLLSVRRPSRAGAAGGDLNTVSDHAAHRADAQAHRRATQVEARVGALAEQDPSFEPDALKERAVWLYSNAQQAWTDRDHATLQQILSPVLYEKWAEELRDYASRGEVNVVEIVSGPAVELVDVANREGEVTDTVTFRVSATLKDYVRTSYGPSQTRKDGSTRPVEYWTLRENLAGHWIVSSVEQAEEGAHHLTDAIETDAWDQKAVARDAVLETAGQSTAGDARELLSLTGVSWSADADAAASDLSLLDARFDKQVLEVAIEQFLEEWAMNDGSLDFTSLRTAASRTVMREAAVTSIEVRSLVSRDPVVFRVAVGAQGVYYEVHRRTEEVIEGNAHTRRPVVFSFDLRLDGPSAKGWTVIAAHAQ